MGPSLAPYGVNLKEFCDRFNKESVAITKGPHWDGDDDSLLRVGVRVTKDKRFEMDIRDVTVVSLLKKLCQIKKGGADAKVIIKEVPMSDIMTIVKRKLRNSNAYDVESFARSVVGTAKSMGIKVVNDEVCGG